MYQRIQSVYLFVAFLLAVIATNFVAFFKINNESVNLLTSFSYDSLMLKSVGVFFILSGVLSVVSLLKFKNRQLQFVYNRINILINFYLLSVLIYLSLNLSGEILISEKGIGVYFPIVIVVLLVIANKAIKKDEDLVKSVDRLR